ncbi:hypothetical protein LB505_013012 [Fusarium chuoi]|nr:hypothetical protein LB505_013012 [Fusarium chuoi]
MRGPRPQWESGHGMTVLEVQESSEQRDSTIIRLSSNVDPLRLGFIKDSLVEVLRLFCEKPDSILASTNIMGAAEYDLSRSFYTAHSRELHKRLQMLSRLTLTMRILSLIEPSTNLRIALLTPSSVLASNRAIAYPSCLISQLT